MLLSYLLPLKDSTESNRFYVLFIKILKFCNIIGCLKESIIISNKYENWILSLFVHNYTAVTIPLSSCVQEHICYTEVCLPSTVL